MGYPYLAKVYSGLTGSLVVASAGGSTTIAPRTRESWASFWARVVTDCYVEQGLSLVVEMIAEGQGRVTGSVTFSMTFAAGTLASAVDFTAGPYSGATSYNSDANTPDYVTVAGSGLRLNGAPLVVGAGRAASDGTAASSVVLGPTLTLEIWALVALAWTLETSLLGVYDIALDTRIFARVRIDGWNRVAVGKLRTSRVTLETQAQAVSE